MITIIILTVREKQTNKQIDNDNYPDSQREADKQTEQIDNDNYPDSQREADKQTYRQITIIILTVREKQTNRQIDR